MKKYTILFAILLSICSSVFANSIEKIQFRQYVEMTQKHANTPQSMSIVADEKYRVIFCTMPLSINLDSVTPKVTTELKENMIKELRKETADVKIIKDLKITIVYSFITTNRKVISIAITYNEI